MVTLTSGSILTLMNGGYISSKTDFFEWVQKRFKVAHSTMLEKETEGDKDD